MTQYMTVVVTARMTALSAKPYKTGLVKTFQRQDGLNLHLTKVKLVSAYMKVIECWPAGQGY